MVSARWVEQRRATGHRPIEPDEVSYLERLGNAVRNRRHEVGLTMVELAEDVGVANTTIEAIEHGARRTRRSTLQRIAEALETYEHVRYGDDGLEDGFAHDVELLLETWVRLAGPALAPEKNQKSPCPTCGHLYDPTETRRVNADPPKD